MPPDPVPASAAPGAETPAEAPAAETVETKPDTAVTIPDDPAELKKLLAAALVEAADHKAEKQKANAEAQRKSKRLAEFEAAEEAAKAASLSDLEKANAAFAKAQEENAAQVAALAKRLNETRVRAAAGEAGFHNPALAIRLLDEVPEDEAELGKALAAVLKDNPGLKRVGAAAVTPTPDATNGADLTALREANRRLSEQRTAHDF